MDFSKAKYRVDQLDDQTSVVTRYADLWRHSGVFANNEGLPHGINYELPMRYLCLMYGPGSPGIEVYPDLSKRKDWALRFLNINPNHNNEYPEYVNDIALFKNAAFRRMAILFLRLQNSEDWSLARTQELRYYNLLQKSLEDVSDIKEAKTLQEAITMCREELVSARDRILMGEKSRELEGDLMQFLADENLGIMPEEYMVEWANNGNVFDKVLP
jgi:hypothetical protein